MPHSIYRGILQGSAIDLSHVSWTFHGGGVASGAGAKVHENARH